MRLEDLLAPLHPLRVSRARAGIDVLDLAYDSRRVTPGALFVCVPGARADGHEHAAAAVAAGAVALVVERELELDVPQAVVDDARRAMAGLADVFFGEPTSTLAVLGVTGTNGKTTTAFLAHAILEAAGLQAGLLGTVEQRVGGAVEPVERTTPEAIDLQRTFRRMLDAGDRAAAIEVSSHALALGRVDGVRFRAAAFTNLTQDHLDFHGTLEDYFAAKALLFDGRCPRAANVDDPWGARLPAELTFAVDAAADVRAEDLVLDRDGARFTLATPAGRRPVATRLVGRFNVSNALAAASAALLAEVDLDAVVAGLAACAGVPGRMERVEAGQPFAVLVDYAHTPDALASVLRTAREMTAGRLVVVFGCGGDRDRAKRPQMGAVAAELADRVLVTSDNPRSEEPEAIIAEILAGIAGPVTVEPDRRAAIALALAGAGPGDVVLIAGKGHEQGQERAGQTAPFDDRAVARELLTS